VDSSASAATDCTEGQGLPSLEVPRFTLLVLDASIKLLRDVQGFKQPRHADVTGAGSRRLAGTRDTRKD
jgi:hypothetical protein